MHKARTRGLYFLEYPVYSAKDPIMKKYAHGFTLIELMIVVVIIGILASVALPVYQNYMARAQFSEGLVVAGSLKADVLAYVGMQGACPLNGSAAVATIKSASKYETKLLDKVETVAGSGSDDCAIEATFKNSGVSSKLAGKKLILTAKDVLKITVSQLSAVNFDCSSDADSSVKPSSCQ